MSMIRSSKLRACLAFHRRRNGSASDRWKPSSMARRIKSAARGRNADRWESVLMCRAEIAQLVEAWDQGELRLGRLDDGSIVPLSFVPDAPHGSYLLVHLGLPVELL